MTRIEFLQSLLAVPGTGVPIGIFTGDTAEPPSDAPASDGAPEVPPGDDDPLGRWRRRPMVPMRATDESLLGRLNRVAEHHGRIEMVYWGGSEPGRARTISPIDLYARPSVDDLLEWVDTRFPEPSERENPPRRRGGASDPASDRASGFESEALDDLARFLAERTPAYVLAWCHRHDGSRTFRLDRIGEVAVRWNEAPRRD